MMIYYFIPKKPRVQRIFRNYVAAYRDYLKIAKRRASAVSPDRKLAWQNVFRLQHLLKEREFLRFNYLFAAEKFDKETLKSLSSIAERLDKGWSEVEEGWLNEKLSTYRRLSREIRDIQSKWDPNALGDSSRVLDQDSKFCDALRMLADRVHECDEGLRRHR
jgi:hypothetical protein